MFAPLRFQTRGADNKNKKHFNLIINEINNNFRI